MNRELPPVVAESESLPVIKSEPPPVIAESGAYFESIARMLERKPLREHVLAQVSLEVWGHRELGGVALFR